MKALLREPLLHFLVLGGVLFALSARRPSEDGEALVVGAGELEHLVATFAATWQRPPDAEELALLVREHVREELACREALRLGLEQDDTIVRRRLRQKLEFLVGDLAAQELPSEAELEALLARRASTFREPATFTFTHVYLSRERHGADLEARAQETLLALRGGVSADELGDPSLLPVEFEHVAADELEELFGPGFAAGLAGLALGAFEGPVASSYGLHLVQLTAREPGRLPPLDELRAELEEEWRVERRAEELEEFYRTLEARQEIRVEAAPAPEESVR